MKKLEYSFFALQCAGLWRPKHWQQGWKKLLYDCYSWFLMFVLISTTVTELIAFVLTIDNMEAFANNVLLLFTMMLDCGKGANILIYRNDIMELMNVLEQDPCRPQNGEEFAIQKKFDELARSALSRFGAIVCSAAAGIMMRSVRQDLPKRKIPNEAWTPFDHDESLVGYSIVFIGQILCNAISSAVVVGFDSLLIGLMLQICAQLNILKHRFHETSHSLPDRACRSSDGDKMKFDSSVSHEARFLTQQVQHHLQICKFAQTSNDLFSIMIFLQCAVSTVVLCTTMMEVSQIKVLSTPFASLILYMAAISVQIFMYCFYGGKVTFESLTVVDAVYESTWPSLSISTQRSLITIMTRSLKPIEFISGNIVTLNLDSFNKLLKLSYSIYNVLQQTQN